MAEQFYHGVELVEIDDGTRSLKQVKPSIIGVVGTAPDADPALFPLDTPVLIAGSQREAAKLGKEGTLPTAMRGIFDQAGALIVVVRVAEGADIAETITNVIGGVDATTDSYTGISALLSARDYLGITPRLLIAPGFDHDKTVVDKLITTAGTLKSMVIVDGPNTTDAAAIAWREQFDSSRLYIVDPWAKVRLADGTEGVEPVSARVAGLICKQDNDRGWWHSPSNNVILGITGMARPISWAFNDTNTRANYLNEHDITTIINQEGYRLWGNRTCSIDPRWVFFSVRRTADMINESVMLNHLWAVDKNITRTYINDVTEGVSAYLRHLKQVGAIIGGRCWADPELNTPDQIAQGHVYFDFDFTAPYPAERITFRSKMVNDYLTEITGSAT